MTIMALELWEFAPLALPSDYYSNWPGYSSRGICRPDYLQYKRQGLRCGGHGRWFLWLCNGATPNAMASMSAVVSHYDRPSPKAFFHRTNRRRLSDGFCNGYSHYHSYEPDTGRGSLDIPTAGYSSCRHSQGNARLYQKFFCHRFQSAGIITAATV